MVKGASISNKCKENLTIKHSNKVERNQAEGPFHYLNPKGKIRKKVPDRNYLWTHCSYCMSISSDPFYVVSYYIKWVTTSWTYGTIDFLRSERKVSQNL